MDVQIARDHLDKKISTVSNQNKIEPIINKKVESKYLSMSSDPNISID